MRSWWRLHAGPIYALDHGDKKEQQLLKPPDPALLEKGAKKYLVKKATIQGDDASPLDSPCATLMAAEAPNSPTRHRRAGAQDSSTLPQMVVQDSPTQQKMQDQCCSPRHTMATMQQDSPTLCSNPTVPLGARWFRTVLKAICQRHRAAPLS
jgi:hypothetical protein